jgi:hypothetical protein
MTKGKTGTLPTGVGRMLFDFRIALVENIARKNLSELEPSVAIKEYKAERLFKA